MVACRYLKRKINLYEVATFSDIDGNSLQLYQKKKTFMCCEGETPVLLRVLSNIDITKASDGSKHH